MTFGARSRGSRLEIGTQHQGVLQKALVSNFLALAPIFKTMSEETLRRQLYDSFKNRAMIYYLIYDELRGECGDERAEEVLSRAIYRRGAEKGRELFARFAPNDLQGLQASFLGGIPDEGRMFQPEVLRSDAEGVDIKFHACPLRDAWQEAGLPEEEIAALCRIAARIDNGTFEGAGFQFSAETWQPGGEGCCFLHFRRGKEAS
jgi:hypothetical protein